MNDGSKGKTQSAEEYQKLLAVEQIWKIGNRKKRKEAGREKMKEERKKARKK